MFYFAITGVLGLILDRDRVDIGRVRCKRDEGATAPRLIDDLFQNVIGPPGTFEGNDGRYRTQSNRASQDRAVAGASCRSFP